MFIDAATQKPLPSKRYYDIVSYLATQLAFSFTVAPFCILSLSGSLTAWARVYFYTVAGVAASMAFFASPAKAALRKRVEARSGSSGTAIPRSASTESLVGQAPVLGLSADPQREIDEMVEEIKVEVEKRRAAGIWKRKAGIEGSKAGIEGSKAS